MIPAYSIEYRFVADRAYTAPEDRFGYQTTVMLALGRWL